MAGGVRRWKVLASQRSMAPGSVVRFEVTQQSPSTVTLTVRYLPTGQEDTFVEDANVSDEAILRALDDRSRELKLAKPKKKVTANLFSSE